MMIPVKEDERTFPQYDEYCDDDIGDHDDSDDDDDIDHDDAAADDDDDIDHDDSYHGMSTNIAQLYRRH